MLPNLISKQTLTWMLICWAVYAQGQEEPMKLMMSPDAGFYRGSVQVQITCNYPKARIYYTTTGSTPTSASRQYSSPLLVDSTCVIYAVAYWEGKSCTEVGSYIFGMDSTTFPVASITIEPAALFDPIRGVFVLGPNGSRSFPHKGANWNSRQEFKTHWEFFETDKKQAFEGDYGLKVFGGVSRMFPQKSFSLAAREDLYGVKRIEHQLFPDKNQKKYKHVVFRNSGSDFGGTHFRDAMITSLGKEMGLEVQAYRPCHTFINGKYWGIYNLREKLNRFYLQENFGYDADSVDLIEHKSDVTAGTRKHYERMQNYMRNNDLAQQRHFDTIATMMDVNNFMEYEIMQIFIENQDAGGNIKFWRPQVPGGKWRWILFDTDFGFAHYGGDNAHKFNSLKFHTAPNGPGWPNPPWSTFNLRMLLKNDGFRDDFILRFADRLNGTLHPDHVIKRIDKMANYILPELPKHWARWELEREGWERRVERMRKFARERPKYIRQFLREMFPHIGQEVRLQIQVDSGGYVLINGTVKVDDKRWEGIYFKNLPIQVKAQPRLGYQFSHWEEAGLQVKDRVLDIRFKDTIRILKPVFIKGEHPMATRFIINEISCRDSATGDWIEFYNSSSEPLDLAGWRLRDGDKNEFIFPTVSIQGNDFLVLCRHKNRFLKAFPTVPASSVLEGLNFGLGSQKERLEVYDSAGDPVDSIRYKIDKEWDGQLVTLSLRDYAGDNAAADSWKVVSNQGSPAAANPNYIEENKKGQLGSLLHYIKIGGIGVAVLVGIVGIYTIGRRRMRRRR